LVITSRKQEIKGLYNGFIDGALYNSFHPVKKPDKLFNEFVKQYKDLLDIFEPPKKLQISYVLSKIKISEEISYIIIKKGIYIYSGDLAEIRAFQKIYKSFFNI